MARAADEPVFAGAPDEETSAMTERGIGATRLSEAISPAITSAAISDILAEVLGRRARRQGLIGSDRFEERLSEVVERIRTDLDWPWAIPDMARLAALSPSQLHRIFKRRLGISPINWLRRERINRARRLLADRALSIAEVGRRCGYADPYHFSRDFRRLCGQSPSPFRAEQGW